MKFSDLLKYQIRMAMESWFQEQAELKKNNESYQFYWGSLKDRVFECVDDVFFKLKGNL